MGAMVKCLQMRSAFWRGVTLLKETPDPDVDQHQWEQVASATEGFRELPRNVALLKNVMYKLARKVAHE
jgi:hypothetical protein